MQFVESNIDLENNFITLDDYILSKRDPEYEFALGLIKRGTCFIAFEQKGEYYFYPSRFVGYKENAMEKHLKNDKKDGRLTNPAISKILGQRPIFDADLNEKYRGYCDFLGIEANEKGSFGVERKYWHT